MSDDVPLWKDELVRIADRLEAKTKQKRWSERTGFLIERDFMLGAYVIRKLIESHEVADEIRQRQIPVKRFDSRRPPPDPQPADIADVYDLANGRRRTLSVPNLCHEIINSLVVEFFVGETTDLFDGVLVSSDRHQNEHLHLVLASDFIALCNDIGTE